MLHLILGAPKSGKSEYAERLIAAYEGPTVYVGTLPPNTYYSNIIREHQERRPPTWGLIELIGNPQADLTLLSGTLQYYRNVLLDGLLFYLLRLIVTFNGDLSLMEQQFLLILTQAAKRGELVVVDPLVQSSHTMKKHKALSYVQLLLVRNASTITFVESRKTIQLTRSQARSR